MPKTAKILILFLACMGIAIPARAIDTAEFFGEGSLILEAVPIEIKPLAPPVTTNAVEDVEGFSGLKEIVSLRIEKISRGKLEKTNLGEGNVVEDVAQGLEKKVFSKSYDPQTPAKKLRKIPFAIAVRDALQTFEMSQDDLGKTKFRLYFRNYKNEATTFILIKTEKIS